MLYVDCKGVFVDFSIKDITRRVSYLDSTKYKDKTIDLYLQCKDSVFRNDTLRLNEYAVIEKVFSISNLYTILNAFYSTKTIKKEYVFDIGEDWKSEYILKLYKDHNFQLDYEWYSDDSGNVITEEIVFNENDGLTFLTLLRNALKKFKGEV